MILRKEEHLDLKAFKKIISKALVDGNINRADVGYMTASFISMLMQNSKMTETELTKLDEALPVALNLWQTQD